MATQEMKSPERKAGVDVKTVLIVDDQAETLASLRRLLRDEPYELVTLGAASDALSWIESNPVHLIISDERMPDMRGSDLLEKVREKSPDTLRVILTGYPGSSTVQHGLSHGVDWLISKPWNNEALKLTIRQLLEDGAAKRRRAASETPATTTAISGPYGQSLFRALVEGVKDYAILMVSPEGRVMSWNIGAERMTGYTAEDILGRPFATLHPPEDIEQGKPQRLLEAALTEDRVEDEGWRLRKDGSRFWCNVIMTAVRDPEGRLVGFAKVTRDMSERRRAEEERARLNAQMLQGQKLQAIGQLSAGIAHEINNPVGYILSNLNTMGEYCQDLRRLLRAATAAADAEARGESSADALKEFRRVAADVHAEHLVADLGDVVSDCKLGGEKIRDIVRSLREFSHVDEGELRPTDLNKCLEDALRICWNELKYKADVQKDYQRDLPKVPAYPQRLGQVFINLLVNAGQAIEKRGQILLTTRAEGDCVTVRIRDTGRGISPEHLSKLFEPFFTTKDVGAGTGLGLHVAYKIVAAHRGRIDVQSVVDQGTEFTVRVPLEGPRSKS
jgi:PAS domain S-box-containing protein